MKTKNVHHTQTPTKMKENYKNKTKETLTEGGREE